MASTYTTGLRLEKAGFGDYVDTWEELLNTQLDLIDQMEATATAISTTGGDTTLSTNNGATDQARPRIYRVTGTLASDANIIVPAISRLIYVVNGTSGAHNVNVKTASGSALAVPQGESRWLLSHTDNTVVFAAPPKTTGTSLLKGDNVGGFAAAAEGTDYYGPAGTDVAVTDGGTGASDAAGARTNLGLGAGNSPQFTGVILADGTVSAPSLAFASDTDNGLYRSGTNLWHLVGGGTALLSVDGANGRIGIGTTTPGSKLEVSGAAIHLNNYTSDAYFYMGSSTSGGRVHWDNNNAKLYLGVNADHAVITSAGDVGIGTAAPGSKLDVDGVIRPKTYTVATLPTIVTGGMLYASDGRKAGEGAASGTGVLVFADGSNWIAVDTGATVAA